MTEKEKICTVCDRPLKDCICCEACGHVCPRDQGEAHCPVCLPEPEAAGYQPAFEKTGV